MSGHLDRSLFEEQLAANAIRSDVDAHVLPSGLTIYLKTPNKDDVRRSWAAAGDDDDRDMIGSINLLKFMLCDELGNALPRNYSEARGWFNAQEDNDANAIMDAIAETIAALGTEADPEAPKGFSAPDPTSSPSTPSAAS